MSTYTYTESHRRVYAAPKIVQSRGSSSDSRFSYDSTSSTDHRHASSKSSMGYYGASQSKVEKPIEYKYRAPDAENKYVEATRRGDVEVIHHQKRVHDPIEPRVSEATSSHYRKERREEERRHSSHKHGHRR